VTARITQGMMNQTLLYDLRNVTNQLSTSEQQLSSGYKLNQPSDDPYGASQALKLRADLASNKQYQSNVQDANSWQNVADTALGDIGDSIQRARDLVIQGANDTNDASDRQAIVTELNQLHAIVGQSVLMHKFSRQAALPTKDGVFDWTLGEIAVQYGRESGYDYALFLYARDSFASNGRVALQAVGYLGCMVGVCAVAPGGSQTAFASLVDLKTGDLVWFNYMQSNEGDIRTQEGADVLVWTLLDSMSAKERANKGS